MLFASIIASLSLRHGRLPPPKLCASSADKTQAAAIELRAARAAAADAANAEARLRSMVAAAHKSGEELAAERDAARAELSRAREDLASEREEAAAARALAAADIEALHCQLDDLERLVAAHDAAAPPEGGGAAEAELRVRITALEAELLAERRTAAFATDAAAEARADCGAWEWLGSVFAPPFASLYSPPRKARAELELAQQEASRDAELAEDARAEAAQLRALGESARPGGGAGEARAAVLEAQVAALLVELSQQEEAAAELLTLRPQAESFRAKAEAYERRLREAGLELPAPRPGIE